MTIYEFLNLELFEFVQVQDSDEMFLVVSKNDNGVLIGRFISNPKDLRKTNLILKRDDRDLLPFAEIKEIN